ncbi:chromosome segregation ATPase [Azospirillum sp. OGB3]|uniref:hypothetical protein n=1 Tax=Azospirillum sp. OGB3 TaxID=2587012 RepID=UPI0016069FB3|nr:hypothetical protein [Azospirillum sp. OGB3]MBB3265541.1 chromosome segregation ATPase [Azospirillum sp. OGB3]
MVFVRIATRTRVLLTAGAALLALSACQSTPQQCDPRQGGFIGGAAGLMSGCYEQRVEERKQTLSSAQSIAQQLQSENNRLQGEKTASAGERTRAQAQLASLDKDNATLQRRLNGLKASTEEQASRKKALNQQLADINRRIGEARAKANAGGADDAEVQREVERLTRQRDALSDDIAAALKGQ